RSNDLDAKQFPEFANQSIAELQAMLGSATDVDQRNAVVTGLRSAVQDIRHQIDSGEIKGRSINPCEGWIAATQQVLTRIEREGLDTFTWKDWFDVATGKVSSARVPAAVGRTILNHIDSEALITDANFQQDLAALVRLVFTTAAECMEAYQHHKAE